MKFDELFAPDPRYTRVDAPNRILMLSSLCFLFPMLAALHSNAVVAAVAAANLTVTSVIYHMTKDVYYFWVDQVAIYLYVVAAVYEAFFKRKLFHQVVVGALCVYSTSLYHYGYMNTCYIWDTDCSLSSAHHAGLHVVGALAGAITFLAE
jgi:hypothetical protein